MAVRQIGMNWRLAQTTFLDADTLPRELDGVLGILRLDGTQTLFAIDGQHRVEGIRQALKENKELGREEVSVILVAHRNDSDGMERTRRLFTTLNRYAKPVSKSEIVALDEDDIIAITTRALVEKHPLFQEKISLQRRRRLQFRIIRISQRLLPFTMSWKFYFARAGVGRHSSKIARRRMKSLSFTSRVRSSGTRWLNSSHL